jgi:hypothetical protein
MIVSADRSQRLLFIRVPDAKRQKNRVHLDLRPIAGTRDEELAELLKLGARVVDDQVLADPEGNEFCILRSTAELERSG